MMISCQNPEFMAKYDLENFIKTIKLGYKAPSDEFFKEGNNLLNEHGRIREGVISFGPEEDLHKKTDIICSIHGCNQEFKTVFAYQGHYNTKHRYLCIECKKSLPTPHLLDIHISEQHDSFFAVQALRKPMFVCFVEECEHCSIDPQERKDHCIKEHKFPSNFRFDQYTGKFKKETKIDKKEIDNDNVNNFKMDTGDASKKQPSFVNKSCKTFTFGHQTQRVFKDDSYSGILTKNRVHKRDKVEMDVSDLLESLPV